MFSADNSQLGNDWLTAAPWRLSGEQEKRVLIHAVGLQNGGGFFFFLILRELTN